MKRLLAPSTGTCPRGDRVALESALAATTVLVFSALLTGLMRKLALSRGVVDVPNERSSHNAPTPRGGGVAIVVTMLAAVVAMTALGETPIGLSVTLLVGGAAVAIVGFVDDHRHVAASVRLTVHFLAVAWCAWSLGRLPPIEFGFAIWDLGIVGTVCAVVFLVWFLNLYNFMDGIDGIASVEAMSIAAIAAALLATHAGDPSTIGFLLVLVAAVGGFLIWNWPPARIFMGDVGSGFLGFALGAIAWVTVVSGQLSVWVWLILFGAFFVDATVTLLRRWRRGERLDVAHRSHAYQRLSRKYRSHLVVTLGFLGINVVWLAPLAWAATAWPSWGGAVTLLAWTPLVVVAWRYGAGIPGEIERCEQACNSDQVRGQTGVNP